MIIYDEMVLILKRIGFHACTLHSWHAGRIIRHYVINMIWWHKAKTLIPVAVNGLRILWSNYYLHQTAFRILDFSGDSKHWNAFLCIKFIYIALNAFKLHDRALLQWLCMARYKHWAIWNVLEWCYLLTVFGCCKGVKM